MKQKSKFLGARIVGEDGLVRTWKSAQDYNNSHKSKSRWNSEQMEQAKKFYQEMSGKRGYEVTGSILAMLPLKDDEASETLKWLHGDLKQIFDTYKTHTLKSGGLRKTAVDRDSVATMHVKEYKQKKENEIAEYYIKRMTDGSMAGAVQTFNSHQGGVGLEGLIRTCSKPLGKELIKFTTPTSTTTPYLDFYNLVEVISEAPGDNHALPIASSNVDVNGDQYKITYELMVPKGSVLEYEGWAEWTSEIPRTNLGFEDLARLTAVYVMEPKTGIKKIMYTGKQNGKGEVPKWLS